MKKGIFLDRDGVINHNVWNSDTQGYESPHLVQDFRFLPGVLEALKTLQNEGYLLFIVSNQPSYAKGKTTLESLQEIHEYMHDQFLKENIQFSDYYYCYHHPEGIAPEYSIVCSCRKPSSYFLERAEEDHGISLMSSWMVGDRDTDVWCGQNAGTRTIQIKEIENSAQFGKSKPDHFCGNLAEAAVIILNSYHT